MTLSIIVPTYLMTPEVRDLWTANLKTLIDVATVPTEYTVIDNGSAYPPDYRTVSWPENKGIAPAWNEGVRHSSGELLAFVTCTTTVEPGWDAKLCAVAESGRYIAMPFTNGAKPYGLGITGWCWVIQRALFDAVGPFDETFVPVQYEDTDFFHRAIYEQGIELVNVKDANVRRAGSRGSINAAPWAARMDWIHMANRYRYGWKHNVDPNDVPPFWKHPLRDVEARSKLKRAAA